MPPTIAKDNAKESELVMPESTLLTELKIEQELLKLARLRDGAFRDNYAIFGSGLSDAINLIDSLLAAAKRDAEREKEVAELRASNDKLQSEAENVRGAFGLHPDTEFSNLMDLIQDVRHEARAYPDSQLKLEVAWEELRKLKEIVGKLPVTADGVPIVPGMNLWHPAQIGERPLYPHTEDGAWWVEVPTRLGRDNFVDQSQPERAEDCFSTRAAALASQQASTGERDGGK